MWEGLGSRRTPVQAFSPHLRGRGIGGSSAINGMIAIRAMPDDYDRWAAAGCPGWSYDDVLPSLRRMEDDADFGDRPYHGDAGPIPVMRQPRERGGRSTTASPTPPSRSGIRGPTITTRRGRPVCHRSPSTSATCSGCRRTMATSSPHRSRPNLRIIGDATVDRVLIEAGRARGVRVRIDGEWVDVHAEHVVLCAGAIHSPSILLRSGIGPRRRRRRRSRWARACRTIRWRCSGSRCVRTAWADIDDRQTNCIVRYSSGLDGGVDNDMAFISQNQTQGAGHAVTEALGGSRRPPVHGASARGAGGRGRGLLCVQLNHERSRGSLRLASPDPDAAARHQLQPAPRDGPIASGSATGSTERSSCSPTPRSRRRSSTSPSTRRVEASTSSATTTAIDHWLMETVGDAAHICGTCRMGSADDTRSVVDPGGRVIGIDSLYVADASIFPEVPRANTNLPVIAAAERMAELLRNRPTLAQQ